MFVWFTIHAGLAASISPIASCWLGSAPLHPKPSDRRRKDIPLPPADESRNRSPPPNRVRRPANPGPDMRPDIFGDILSFRKRIYSVSLPLEFVGSHLKQIRSLRPDRVKKSRRHAENERPVTLIDAHGRDPRTVRQRNRGRHQNEVVAAEDSASGRRNEGEPKETR